MILETLVIFTFYDFPRISYHFSRTSNVIESFDSLLKRNSRKRILFNKEDNASLVIVQNIVKYNNEQKGRIVGFIKDLNEDERNVYEFLIMQLRYGLYISFL